MMPIADPVPAVSLSPPDLIHIPEFLRYPDRYLRALLGGVEWDARFRSRLTASFGRPCQYGGTDYADRRMHPVLVPVADRIASALGWMPNNCLLNLYQDGSSDMGFRSDEIGGLAPDTGIAIVSLGAVRDLTFRHCADRGRQRSFAMLSGSLLFMSCGLQSSWMHAVLPRSGLSPRISLTFRRIL